uniref:Uncharacterized protein n=1 Tax=Anguilla anguilla TaxID=7936 RepID=A0A0E9TFN7_ANGAN
MHKTIYLFIIYFD